MSRMPTTGARRRTPPPTISGVAVRRVVGERSGHGAVAEARLEAGRRVGPVRQKTAAVVRAASRQRRRRRRRLEVVVVPCRVNVDVRSGRAG